MEIVLAPRDLQTNEVIDELQITLLNSVNTGSNIKGIDYASKSLTYLFSFADEDFYLDGEIVRSTERVLTASYINHWIDKGDIYIINGYGDVFRLTKNLKLRCPLRQYYASYIYRSYSNYELRAYNTFQITNNVSYGAWNFYYKGKFYTFYEIVYNSGGSDSHYSLMLSEYSADGMTSVYINRLYLNYQYNNMPSAQSSTNEVARVVQNGVIIGTEEYAVFGYQIENACENGNKFRYLFLALDVSDVFVVYSPITIDSDFTEKATKIYYRHDEDKNYYYTWCYTENKDVLVKTLKTDGSTTTTVTITHTLFDSTDYNSVYETDDYLILSYSGNDNQKRIFKKIIDDRGHETTKQDVSGTTVFWQHRQPLYYFTKYKTIYQISPNDDGVRVIRFDGSAWVLDDTIAYVDGDEVGYTPKVELETIGLQQVFHSMQVQGFYDYSSAGGGVRFIKAVDNLTSGEVLSNVINYTGYATNINVFVENWDDYITYEIDDPKNDIVLTIKRGKGIFFVVNGDKNILAYTDQLQIIQGDYIEFEDNILFLDDLDSYLLIVLANGTKYSLSGFDNSTFILTKVNESITGKLLCSRNYIEYYQNTFFYIYRGKIINTYLPLSSIPVQAIQVGDNIIFKTDTELLYILDPFTQSICKVVHISINDIDNLYLKSDTNRFTLVDSNNTSFEIRISNNGRPISLINIFTIDNISKVIDGAIEYNAFQQGDLYQIPCNIQLLISKALRIEFNNIIKNIIRLNII